MATVSSILAWRIPWTEESGRLQSIGSQSWTRLKRLSSAWHSIYYNSYRQTILFFMILLLLNPCRGLMLIVVKF